METVANGEFPGDAGSSGAVDIEDPTTSGRATFRSMGSNQLLLHEWPFFFLSDSRVLES